jgi:GNAT superfamily N-acetyltransferase
MAAATSTSKDGDYKLRAVTMKDAARCREIAAVTYGGHDFLMEALDRWLSDPAKYTVKCLADPTTDKLCAVEAVGVVDAGTTGWIEGLRTHPDHRRKGLARRIQRELVDEYASRAQEKGSTLRRLRYATRSDNHASIKIGEACGLEIVDTWGFLFKSGVDSLVAALEGAVEGTEGGDIAPAEPAAVAALLASASGQIPTLSRLIVDWKVHQLSPGTVQQLADSVAAEFVVGQGALSHGQPRPDATSSSWCVSVYSDNSLAATVKHLLWHCRRAKALELDCMMLFFDHALTPHLGNESAIHKVADVFPGADTCILLERELSES